METLSLDRAVTYFGDSLRAELESVSDKNQTKAEMKRQLILGKWLALPSQQRFKDPARRGR